LRIAYAGALSVQKGIHDLLEAFALANVENAELILLGGKTKVLDALLRVQPESVKMFGHRPQAELASHYRECHCFVMPSIQEGMAMVQLQALACGLPLICTSNTGGEDLLCMLGDAYRQDRRDVQEFDAGFVVPVNSPAMIAHCLRRIALEPGLWERKREAAIELARHDLSWKRYGERAISNYEAILDLVSSSNYRN
jgi:glycosyltransferase involved in cell wall biosynthesis